MRPLRSPHVLVSAAGYGLGALALYWGLPREIPAPLATSLLPTALLLTDAMLRGLTVRHPVDAATEAQVLLVYDAIMLRMIVFVTAVHALVLSSLLGMLDGRAWAGRIVPLMLGLTMISIGNLLPRTRPNLAIGIRTRRTLSDRSLWIRVHRYAGYVVVASGALIALSAIGVPGRVGSAMILVVGPIAFVATWGLTWSCARHARA
jgi:uncharacterized membrane protein